jgi:hypothetical protein
MLALPYPILEGTFLFFFACFPTENLKPISQQAYSARLKPCPSKIRVFPQPVWPGHRSSNRIGPEVEFFLMKSSYPWQPEFFRKRLLQPDLRLNQVANCLAPANQLRLLPFHQNFRGTGAGIVIGA